MSKDTPAWGSDEFNKAIEEHDRQADPKREEAGHKYTDKPDKGKDGGKGKK